MKICYNSSLWAEDKGIHGLPQRINWHFEHAGTKRCIPVIYRFPKGIVFDVITFLDETKLKEFFERYETIEKTLTPLQRRCAEQEHPYQTIAIKEIWVNDKRIENSYSSSSNISVPWMEGKDELIPVRKAYSSILKDKTCFACARFCVPYPETSSRIEKAMRLLRLNRVKNMKLSTYPERWFSPLDIHFEMSGKENQRAICFKHPITGTVHTLYFQNAEYAQMPMPQEENRSIYVMQSMYEIEPALPKGDTLQFNNGINYTKEEKGKGNFTPTAAASIGIIGGTFGHTGIFISRKGREEGIPRGLHGLPINNCFSVPSFENGDSFHFNLEGINTIKYDGSEYNY